MQLAMFCTGGVRCEKASAYLIQVPRSPLPAAIWLHSLGRLREHMRHLFDLWSRSVGLFEVRSGSALRKSSNSTVRKSDGRIDAIRAGRCPRRPAGSAQSDCAGGILSYLREIPPEQSLWRVRPKSVSFGRLAHWQLVRRAARSITVNGYAGRLLRL